MADWIERPAEYEPSASLAENKRRPRGIVRCHCGSGVSLNNAMYPPDYAAACEKCGQLFNLSGQELRPRDEWEPDDDSDY